MEKPLLLVLTSTVEFRGMSGTNPPYDVHYAVLVYVKDGKKTKAVIRAHRIPLVWKPENTEGLAHAIAIATEIAGEAPEVI